MTEQSIVVITQDLSEPSQKGRLWSYCPLPEHLYLCVLQEAGTIIHHLQIHITFVYSHLYRYWRRNWLPVFLQRYKHSLYSCNMYFFFFYFFKFYICNCYVNCGIFATHLHYFSPLGVLGLYLLTVLLLAENLRPCLVGWSSLLLVVSSPSRLLLQSPNNRWRKWVTGERSSRTFQRWRRDTKDLCGNKGFGFFKLVKKNLGLQ